MRQSSSTPMRVSMARRGPAMSAAAAPPLSWWPAPPGATSRTRWTRIMAALMANRCPAARPAPSRPPTIGAAHARQAAPMAAIHQDIAPAGPLAAASTWAVALPADGGTDNAGRNEGALRAPKTRAGSLVHGSPGCPANCGSRTLRRACEVGNIKALVEQLYHQNSTSGSAMTLQTTPLAPPVQAPNVQAPQVQATLAQHPLEQLSAQEIHEARRILAEAGLVADTTRFAYLGLVEPPKKALQGDSCRCRPPGPGHALGRVAVTFPRRAPLLDHRPGG